ncbi:DUF3604 domain-containing protein [Mangrovimicrobium sediminis]|uniref:DUF3604 domain-containing protein n=1 Tax=Mangrovimicrobium sediminis TaxID=2562682 RepID=A0A4Z0M439_9GAMM|nr:DUF3604 domain-containing protein [Haliea sp. SAOS-164]TGD74261.1 DUF3604 domain-containing protein [Haliea sp. SAOS-164]
MRLHNKLLAAVSLGFLATSTLQATEFLPEKDKLVFNQQGIVEGIGQSDFSPYAGRDFPTQVFWGDTHLHTAVSVDAGTMNTVGQEDALRFARGEEITTTHGLRARLGRPLDFVVVADHAEMYGLMPQLLSGDPKILATEKGKRWYEALTTGDADQKFATAMEIVDSLSKKDPPIDSPEATRSAWDAYTRLADQYNDPGRFTALIGYEWTAIGGYNLHRNVIFRGDGAEARKTLPFSQFDSQNPEDLWRALDTFSRETGAQVLAIPHNGNLSNGRLFSVQNFDGTPLSKDLAAMRARTEPLMEVTQIKGDGEAHPFLSPDDEFADFETWDAANLNGTELKEKSMLQYEYAREALKNGLKLERSLGVNPFRFGMIGSTDSHTSMATAEEENFFGKHSGVEPEPGRWKHVAIEAQLDPKLSILGWQQAAAGYAGVWATENTREAIFDAMRRKEVYATTGSRMTVRFFGGWSFEEGDFHNRTPAYTGYAKGVPMGGDLGEPAAKQPSFMVAAMKDPYSGNLDRIQVVKGWLDKAGKTHEKVYDVAWSDGRKPGRDGKLPAVGNTVDVASATWENSIGAAELMAIWKDPDFDRTEPAFYYARVIEIPTPRWTAYEAKRFGVKMDAEVPMTIQERAYTSPIWYNP